MALQKPRLHQLDSKHVKELGLAVTYKTDDAFRHFCGMLNGLAFLPVQKLESLPYIFVADSIWVYRHSNLCSGLQKTHLFCTRVRFGRSRSSEVDDFGTNRKRVCDFLLVGHCDYGPILHRF